eukprot:TRINITY_DN8024_c0_g2_i2.p1 TRINITY_DN8024_c0_g2~~TRINITY_DN8024_c0_g2_i2.p1  ORF type:complete len:264 (+),score=43.88 TRINITY_DN8024_c0_g2_i2:27-818(+)
MMENHDEDIFYSDDELSDSELFQTSSFASKYFSDKSESIFSTRLRQNSSGNLSPQGVSLSNANLNANMIFNTIDSPINQISSGISSLLSKESQRNKTGPVKQLSYSSMAKKEPLQTIKPQHNIPAPKPVARTNSLINKPELKKALSASKVTETALSAGYRFKARNPEADPRYPCEQQLMVGPIPGHLEHDVIYNGLRGIFQARGPVCFMFVHKSAVKDNDSGKLVKFGYVVFAEKGVAQKLLKEGSITFGGGQKIRVREMMEN